VCANEGTAKTKTDEHFRLALRSKLSEQPERAAYHFRVVLDRQPEHRAARRALGYKLTPAEGRTRATPGQPRWVRQPSERTRAKDALRRTFHKDPAERLRGRYLVLALEPVERRRALALLLRNRHADMRFHAVRDLAKHARRKAVTPLMQHLTNLHGSDGGQYISQNVQRGYVQDFDVEIA